MFGLLLLFPVLSVKHHPELECLQERFCVELSSGQRKNLGTDLKPGTSVRYPLPDNFCKNAQKSQIFCPPKKNGKCCNTKHTIQCSHLNILLLFRLPSSTPIMINRMMLFTSHLMSPNRNETCHGALGVHWAASTYLPCSAQFFVFFDKHSAVNQDLKECFVLFFKSTITFQAGKYNVVAVTFWVSISKFAVL